METTTITRNLGWDKIFALAALDAGIVISWTAYHNFQPQLLKHFHFEHLTRFVLITQCLVMLGVPILAGWLTDYYRKKTGSGFFVFALGISVASLIFMAVSFTISDQTFVNMVWLLPSLIVFWLISMNIFHSPANSMLELFAPTKKLPAAMAMMVLTTDLLYAFEPVVVDIVDSMGPVVTFAFGGVLLIVTGYFFRRTTRDVNFSRDSDDLKSTESNFGVVLATGLSFGIIYAIVKNYLPGWIMSKSDITIPMEDGGIFVSLVLITAALTAWPLSFQVDKIGLKRSVVIGILGSALSLALVYFVPSEYPAVAFALITGAFLSLASVSTFPFALQNLSVKSVTIGTGLFFGSFELAEAIISVLENS